MNLQQLQNRIAEEASRNNGEVIMGVLNKLRDAHVSASDRQCADGCDCEYCIALRKYIRIKIRLHCRKKRLYFDTKSLSAFDDFAAIKQDAKTAKAEKDLFKDLHL